MRHYCPVFVVLLACCGIVDAFHCVNNVGSSRLPWSSLLLSRRSQQQTKLQSSSVLSSALSSSVDQEKTKPRFTLYVLEKGRCPYAARTWMTMLELGLDFETVEVNARSKPDWFLALNPLGKVPTVIDNDNSNDDDAAAIVVYESLICNEYLCDLVLDEQEGNNASSSSSLLRPASAAGKASMRLLCHHFDENVATAQYTFFMNSDDTKDAELQQTLEEALDVLEDQLLTSGGPFFMGSELSLVDVHIWPFFLRLVVSLEHFKDGYTLSSSSTSTSTSSNRFSHLLQWFETVQARPSAQATAMSANDIVTVYQMFRDINYKFGGLNKKTT